jgi:hypothetical protein
MGEADANNDATALHLKTNRNQSYEQEYSIHHLFDNARIFKYAIQKGINPRYKYT